MLESTSQPDDISRLLDAVREGNESAGSDLLTVVYEELRRLAHSVFQKRSDRHTLQPTALVHEAWMKLTGNLDSIESRRHFFAVAALAMRQVLADHARAARREKRGGDQTTIMLSEDALAGEAHQPDAVIDLLDFDDALSRLSVLNERHARIAEMRLLGALTNQEIADELGTSLSTIEKDWRMARAWLNRELQ